jgi:hypothetical protein
MASQPILEEVTMSYATMVIRYEVTGVETTLVVGAL